MKKILLGMVILLWTPNLFSQTDDEKRLGIKSLGETAFKVSSSSSIDCGCSNNILKDGGFQSLTPVAGGSDIAPTSAPWKKGFNTPQWTSATGACDKGFVSMWGNKFVGESIYQNLSAPLVAGRQYRIKFTARFLNPTKLSTFVRLKIFAYNGNGAPGSYDASGIISPNITGAGWATYTTTTNLTGAGQTSIALHPENDYTNNDGAYVSWLQIDNICIEEVCRISDAQCNPKFTAAAFSVNSQGNIVVNVNPTVTAGATHYWGMAGATGISDNSPIPLSTIASGGSFGLSVTSTGVATHIGMGTGITASTSGYGYHYEGAALGTCFKITHYIKCCNKWYSRTITYCTRLCTDVKESEQTEVPIKEVEKFETIPVRGGKE